MTTRSNPSFLTLKRFAATSVALSALVLAAAPALQAQDEKEQPGIYAQDDPRAQLDPALRDVPPIPQPKYENKAAARPELALRVALRNVRTGRTVLGEVQRPLPGRAAAAVAPGQPGLMVDQEQPPRPDRSVLGADNRVRITNTQSYPWSAQCKLYMRFPNGLTYVGSGTLINAKYVLTAGHCVYSRADGGWATSIRVIPGLNGTYKPFGEAYATYMRTYTGWTQYAQADHDFALLTLNRTVGNSTGWLGYGWWSSVNGVPGNLSGYPADRDGGVSQYYHYGPIATSTSQRLFYQIDTAGGQSGSGVYRILNGARYVMGAHAYGAGSGSYNSATRIDSTKFNSLRSWIASGY